MEKSKEISIRRPDDWHLHLRDGKILKAALWYTTRCFARAIVMPNLSSPIISTELARNYKRRILDALPRKVKFTPLIAKPPSD